MNYKLLLILILVTSSMGLEVFGQDKFFVTAPDGLICRSGSSLSAERIGKLPYGSIVEMVDSLPQQDEVYDTGKMLGGTWVKVKYENSPYLISSKEPDGYYQECFVFDAFIQPLNQARIETEEIGYNVFMAHQAVAGTDTKKPLKITDFEVIRKMLAGKVTWIAHGMYDNRVMDLLKLDNGQTLKINQFSNDCGLVAYYPGEQILLFECGHNCDFSISIQTGETAETVGNPEYIINSPNNKLRLTGSFGGQECSSYFFQEINGTRLTYLVEFGLGTSSPYDDICNFKSFTWIDDESFVYSYEDYFSSSDAGVVRYFKGVVIR